ncbi:MAG: radical SAM protein [Deltaproteobacteria bacterium]|nr:radical SAM protein [Deltaproteobacteria bacterium]
MLLADILRQDRYLAWRAGRLRHQPEMPFPVLSTKIKLTWHCQLRCRVCRLWSLAQFDPAKTSLPVDLVKSILTELRAHGLRKVHFSGGEVLTYTGFKDVVSHARSLDLQVNFTTNGVLLDKAWARFLVKERVHTITFSVDAPYPELHDAMRGVKGAWKGVWKGITAVQSQPKKAGRSPVIAVNTVITRDNIDHLGDLYGLLLSHGITQWRLLPVASPDKKVRPTPEQWSALAAQATTWQNILTRPPILGHPDQTEKSARYAQKGRYAGAFYDHVMCLAPWFHVFIEANGTAYPCCMGKAQMPVYGNLMEDSLEDILTSPRRQEIRYTLAAGRVFPVCHNCMDFVDENQAVADLSSAELAPPETGQP